MRQSINYTVVRRSQPLRCAPMPPASRLYPGQLTPGTRRCWSYGGRSDNSDVKKLCDLGGLGRMNYVTWVDLAQCSMWPEWTRHNVVCDLGGLGTIPTQGRNRFCSHAKDKIIVSKLKKEIRDKHTEQACCNQCHIHQKKNQSFWINWNLPWLRR